MPANSSTYAMLLAPGRIGALGIKNRVVQAPLSTRYGSRDGSVTPRILRYYRERATGGVGLVIVEFTYIDTEGSQGGVCQLGAYDEQCIPGLALLAQTIKENGAQAGLQLAHCGRLRHLGTNPTVAPSAVPCEELVRRFGIVPRELKVEEIERITGAFGDAAKRVKRAGFDLIEIHGAHGYLLTNFLSSLSNKRTDRYGGSLENRMRFPLEVFGSVRKVVGRDFPLGVRITADEYTPGGITVEEAKSFSKKLYDSGVDVIHVSASPPCGSPPEPMYLPLATKARLAEAIKSVVGVPVIASGSITSPQLANAILESGQADFISLGRPLLADPFFVRKVEENRAEDIVPCIRCQEGCIRRGANASSGVMCAVNVAVGREDEYSTIDRAPRVKNVAVIGGGPGGMEAARVAAVRGHVVTLYEREDLGGLLKKNLVMDFKRDLGGLVEYYSTQIEKLRVTVVKKEATADLISDEKFDELIVATGSEPVIPRVPGVEKSSCTTYLDVLDGKMMGDTVIVIGGGMVGSEITAYVASQGKKLKLVEMLGEILRDVEPTMGKTIVGWFERYGVEVHVDARLQEVTNDGVIVVDSHGKEGAIVGDTVVLSLGMKPRDKLAQALRERKMSFVRVGDCREPRKIYDAIHEGHIVARNL